MASTSETVLLKSTLFIQNKAYSVKLTSSEIYWETITSARAPGGPYSEPLVHQKSNRHQYGSTGGQTPVSTDQSQPSTEGASYQSVKLQVTTEEGSTSQVDESVNARQVLVARDCVDIVCANPMGISQPFPLPRHAWKKKTQHLCKTENQTVKICEVLAVQIDTKSSGGDGKFQHVEMVALSATSFVIYIVRHISKHRWRHRTITFHSRDSSVIQQWVEKIAEIINKPELHRPKRLLVFINPYGGKKRGPKIYRDKVAPLFDIAGITTDVIVTKRMNHARDTLLEYDLKKVDGVVCVGGDGMFSELMHGLLTQALREAGIDHLGPGDRPIPPRLPVGIIPSGSTDTVSWSINGCSDPVTAALHIILGDSVSIDVSTVHHGNQFLRYNVSLLGYGYYGDCLLDSERNRWMGPKRYDWAGFKKLLGNQTYEGEVCFLPSLDKENNPRDGMRCRAGCQVCQAVPQSSTTHDREGAPSVRQEDEISVTTSASGPGGGLGREWQKVKGRFVAINCFVMPCRCGLSPEGAASCAHLGDGCIDLVLIHECSRPAYLKHLVRCMDRKSDQFDFPFIQTFRVKEVQFRPLVDDIEDTHDMADGQQQLRSKVMKNSVWNCDGEIIEEISVDIRCHRQVMKLYGRGIEDEVLEEVNNCPSCACAMRT